MYCKNCGKDIGDAKFCPECGQPADGAPKYTVTTGPELPNQKKPKKKKGKVVLIIIAVIVVLSVIGSLSSPDSSEGSQSSSAPTGGASEASSEPEPSSEEEELPDLEVLEHSMTNDGYWDHVVGKIKNNTDKTYTYVQVEINLYNGDTLVGSTLANVNNLGPGAVWEFDAIVLEEAGSYTRYVIEDITAL